MEQQEQQFIDAESGTTGSQEKLTFREIVLNHLRKIGSFASVEWHGGFWQTKLAAGGNITERFYIPNSREVYSNAVDYLADILFPHFDEEMRGHLKKHEESITAIDDELQRKLPTNEKRDMVKQRYSQKRVEKKRAIFRELSCFLKRSRYLEGAEFEDQMEKRDGPR